MQVVPLNAIPNQTLSVLLGNQACQLNVFQSFFGVFMDVYVDDGATLIIAGVLCENKNRIVRSSYLGFVGDFVFVDTQAPTDQPGLNPYYAGLGDRYQLVYLEAADLLTLQV